MFENIGEPSSSPFCCILRLMKELGRFAGFRRVTHEVRIGSALIGAHHPILVQSMTTTSTKDVAATIAQTVRLAKAGCDLVRITTPTQTDAACLEKIVAGVRSQGVTVPLCADIHFQPAAAFEAIKWVEKVRINPGNFVDAKTAYGFRKDFTESDYDRGLQKIADKFAPLVREAKSRGVALRIGTNHGSLSDRILARYGDTPEGMVVSALEYLAVCEAENFDQVVFSMKASNPKVVIQCYRMLVQRLAEGGHKAYPLHLGVTEAGEGRDGRLKSAVGIGALLLDGLGDTIRVSLTEDPVEEIAPGRTLVRACIRPFAEDVSIATGFGGTRLAETDDGLMESCDPLKYARRETAPVQIGGVSAGSGSPVRVGADTFLPERKERAVEWTEEQLASVGSASVVASSLETQGPWGVRRLAARLSNGSRRPLLALRWKLNGDEEDELRMAAVLGSLLCDGYGDLVALSGKPVDECVDLAYDVLQAAGARQSKASFVSCPSCGRTLFDLVETSARIRARTGHLKDVSIAIMGCIVNGPGEMADADFGYVGGAPGTVSLYVGRDCVRKGVPEAQAPDALVELIKEQGRWSDPE